MPVTLTLYGVSGAVVVTEGSLGKEGPSNGFCGVWHLYFSLVVFCSFLSR